MGKEGGEMRALRRGGYVFLVCSGCTLLEVVQYQQHADVARCKHRMHTSPRKI